MRHKGVLVQEVLRCLSLSPGQVVVDGTIGSGGHAREILKAILPGGMVIGLDQDPAAIERCGEIFKGEPAIRLYHENFGNLEKILKSLNRSPVDAVILDVGLSSEQLEDAGRGFSFDRKGPLDMRMNPDLKVTARDLVNRLPERELETLFRNNGNERWARRIARSICRQRVARPLETTEDLVAATAAALPGRPHFRAGRRLGGPKRHPATRIFQALRMAVNDERGALVQGLPAIWKGIRPGGRFAVITFHSGEDRLVKHFFRDLARTGDARLLARKPITPSAEEVRDNPRSRSAKLRAAEKTR